MVMRPGRTTDGVAFPGAPPTIKMACGENPKRVYGERGPSTRMGNWAGVREAFVEAGVYREKWDRWARHGGAEPERSDARH